MTIDKRPSGNYRIRHTENGKNYSITVPYKPTKKEAYELIRAKIDHTSNSSMTFKQAAEDYINNKSNVLSPATVRAYRSIVRNLPDYFLNTDLCDIDTYTLQKYVNEFSAGHSPKSTHNINGFIVSVVHMYYPERILNVTLPQMIRKEKFIPSLDDARHILEANQATKYFVPIYLAMLSLRNSEICALTMDDLKGNRLTINKALVRSENGYVLKETPKTDKSNRTITLPAELVDAINEQGYIYQGYPRQIYKAIRRTQKKLGLPLFGIHTMRHFFASYSHDLGYSDAVIQQMGGWSTDNVMKSVYRHAMNTDQAQESIASDFSFLRPPQDKIGQDFS